MKTNRSYDAVLEQAYFPRNPDYHGRICGYVYGVTKGRFTNGEDIYTNLMVSASYAEDGLIIIKTKSGTRYLIKSWRLDPIEEQLVLDFDDEY